MIDCLIVFQGMLQYQVVNPELKWSYMFGTLEDNAANMNITDYSLSQTTLEQVFVLSVLIVSIFCIHEISAISLVLRYKSFKLSFRQKFFSQVFMLPKAFFCGYKVREPLISLNDVANTF